MTTRRPTLADFSREVRDDDIKTNQLVEKITAANENYRILRTTPIKDHASHIESIAEGGPVVPFADIASQTREAAILCRDLNEAREQRHQKSRAVRQKALSELAKTLIPEERAILKRAATGLGDFYVAYRGYQELQDYLIAQGGLVGICLTDFGKLFGHPNDRNSNLGMLFQELFKLGALDKMPAGLK
jgi:uncharacterized membrane protein